MDDIPVIVISLRDNLARRDECGRRLAAKGVKHSFAEGVNAKVVGITPLFRYMRDDPVNGYGLAPHHIGIWLSHYNAWSAIRMSIDAGWTNAKAFMICEDDADFHDDWKQRVDAALETAPSDWDMIFPGSCDCGETIKNPPAGTDLYRAQPLCLHCYIVTPKAIDRLLSNHRKLDAPIDVAMFDHSYPSMCVYAILPRCVDQMRTELNP